MRFATAFTLVLLGSHIAVAGEPMPPDYIKATFFTAQPYRGYAYRHKIQNDLHARWQGVAGTYGLARWHGEVRHLETQCQRLLYQLGRRSAELLHARPNK